MIAARGTCWAVLLLLVLGAGCGCSSGADPPSGTALSSPVTAADTLLPVPPGVVSSVTLNGRRLLLYVPKALGGGPLPVVLVLHGYGATPEQMLTYDTLGRWNELAERDGFVVAYPEASGGIWAACGSSAADLDFFANLLSVLGKAYPIDPKRVYAAGHSYGAQMALRVALDRPETYAAVMANAAPAGSCGGGSKAVPVFLTYGTADPLVSYGGNAQTTLDVWLARNLAQLPAQILRLPDAVPEDQSKIDELRFSHAPGGAETVLWRMNGAGHAWPNPSAYPASLQSQFGRRNQDADGADAAWAFFKDHPMP